MAALEREGSVSASSGGCGRGGSASASADAGAGIGGGWSPDAGVDFRRFVAAVRALLLFEGEAERFVYCAVYSDIFSCFEGATGTELFLCNAIRSGLAPVSTCKQYRPAPLQCGSLLDGATGTQSCRSTVRYSVWRKQATKRRSHPSTMRCTAVDHRVAFWCLPSGDTLGGLMSEACCCRGSTVRPALASF